VYGRELLYFSDNGLGIDLNKYGERIFGLYQRFHSHKDSKGMGLYIAHSQAKAMGGNLSVTSKVNQGTTFILEF
jgi:signal transduction histidine kinase